MRVLLVINIVHMLVTVSECTSSNDRVETDGLDHNADETQQAMSNIMDQAIETARKLTGYTGQLKPNGEWQYTTGNKPLKLYAPQDMNMSIRHAIRHCKLYAPNTPGTRLWDGDTTIAANMPDLTVDHKYWITSMGRTAADNIRHCAILEINEAGTPGSIKISQYSDCRDDTIEAALPVCLGDPDNLSAGQEGYRAMQIAVNDKIASASHNTVEELEAIKEELVDQTLTQQENSMIKIIMEQVEENIKEILRLDGANLPEFEKI